MNDCVLNEYVHVDWINSTGHLWDVVYEPLDKPAETVSIRGGIYIIKHDQMVDLVYGSSTFLVGSDDVAWGTHLRVENRISLSWLIDPGEHFLCVSYDVCYKKEPGWDFSWLKEGF